MNTSIIVEGYEQVMLTGEYELVLFNEKELVVSQLHYELHCEAEELEIEELSDEQLIFTCSSINRIAIIKKADQIEEA